APGTPVVLRPAIHREYPPRYSFPARSAASVPHARSRPPARKCRGMVFISPRIAKTGIRRSLRYGLAAGRRRQEKGVGKKKKGSTRFSGKRADFRPTAAATRRTDAAQAKIGSTPFRPQRVGPAPRRPKI